MPEEGLVPQHSIACTGASCGGRQPVEHVLGASPVPPRDEGAALEAMLTLLHAHSGHDFSAYKKGAVLRRLQRRKHLHNLLTLDDYARFARDNEIELKLLFNELLIGVTSFFRDAAMWDVLKEVIARRLLERPRGGTIRAWCAGCSSGEEAYSLAILFAEALEAMAAPDRPAIQIFATDIHRDAVAAARIGLYHHAVAAGVSAARLKRYFTEEQGYRINKEIRRMITFSQQDLLLDPPFSRMDLILCRNLLMYLQTAQKTRILSLFQFSLNPRGILVLGKSESCGTSTREFLRLQPKLPIYQRAGLRPRIAELGLPLDFTRSVRTSRTPVEISGARPQAVAALSIEGHVEHLLLEYLDPAAVLVSATGDILFFKGHTGRYLEPAAGKVNWNLFAMAREGLGKAMREAFQQALHSGQATRAEARVDSDSGVQEVSLNILPVVEPASLRGTFLVIFQPTPATAVRRRGRSSRDDADRAALCGEIERARNDLHSTQEEMQTAQEELLSANEELQSANEELQSTNEELTTSKEEMQSMNQELQIVNAELHIRLHELSRANNDLRNVLDNVDVAILILDTSLNLRRFTPPVAEFISLRPSDLGRPLSHFATRLDYAAFGDDARRVLRTSASVTTEVGSSSGGRVRVRLGPYRTQNDGVDGIIVTLEDLGGRREAARTEADTRNCDGGSRFGGSATVCRNDEAVKEGS